jgi:hypothetical protein
MRFGDLMMVMMMMVMMMRSSELQPQCSVSMCFGHTAAAAAEMQCEARLRQDHPDMLEGRLLIIQEHHNSYPDASRCTNSINQATFLAVKPAAAAPSRVNRCSKAVLRKLNARVFWSSTWVYLAESCVASQLISAPLGNGSGILTCLKGVC